MGNRMSSSLIDRTTEKEITQRVVSFFVCISTPQSHFVRQLPGRGAFWYGENSSQKPALKGEVDASATSSRRG